VKSIIQGYELLAIVVTITIVLSPVIMLQSILKVESVEAQNRTGDTTSNVTSKNQGLQNITDANSYIVTLKNQSSSADVDGIIKAVEEKGANVTHIYNHSIIGFSVQVPSDKKMETMDLLLNDTRIISVEPDQTMTIPRPLE
jgi:hypothetical protein